MRAQTWLAGLINALALLLRPCVKFCLVWLIIRGRSIMAPVAEGLKPPPPPSSRHSGLDAASADHLSCQLARCTPSKRTPSLLTGRPMLAAVNPVLLVSVAPGSPQRAARCSCFWRPVEEVQGLRTDVLLQTCRAHTVLIVQTQGALPAATKRCFVKRSHRSKWLTPQLSQMFSVNNILTIASKLHKSLEDKERSFFFALLH